MSDTRLSQSEPVVLERADFQKLLDVLSAEGYRVIGPTVQDNAVVYDDLDSVEEMPAGWADEKDGGRYRLVERADDALFGYTVGPQSWKQYLHPPEVRLWQAQKQNGSFEIVPEVYDAPRFAFVGVRPCEIAAIAIQDAVFMRSDFTDATYAARRAGVFIAAVNCTEPGGTCFCASMGTGPGASSGFDLALTEVIDDGAHYFVVEAGSEQGEAVLAALPCRPATEAEVMNAANQVEAASGKMGRSLNTEGLKDLLTTNYEHPRWEAVANRCLACANCTMVCPTCFCNTIEDVTDLTGEHAERIRKWDSCFTMDFSYIHGGSVRYSAKARYRQWMTHKLANWVDQFGTFGCVGCGRCITWCPVAIDITEEARAIQGG